MKLPNYEKPRKKIKNLNRPITSNETEAVIKKLPKDQDQATSQEFYQALKEEAMSIFLKLFPKS